jgi:hypothetical protein
MLPGSLRLRPGLCLLDLACAHWHLAAPICWRRWEGIPPEHTGRRFLPSRCPPKDYSSLATGCMPRMPCAFGCMPSAEPH